MEAEVKLFTLNCWGLGLGISKDRDERMQVREEAAFRRHHCS
jgi:hypothetical protein